MIACISQVVPQPALQLTLKRIRQRTHALLTHSKSPVFAVADVAHRHTFPAELTGLGNSVLALEWNSVAPVCSATAAMVVPRDAAAGHDGDASLG